MLHRELIKPETWESGNWSEEEKSVRSLCVSSAEYNNIKHLISSSFSCNVLSIQRIENPFLWGCYLLKKEEYKTKKINVKEETLFHCTAWKNMDAITKNNLDWRKTVRGRFGQGVSFSPFPNYAHKYANSAIGSNRAMIVAKVLIGNATHGNYCVDIPPECYDTTKDISGNVFVKYYDYEFYPTYVVNYCK